MSEQDIHPPRIRVSWKMSTKGIWTPELTIEGEGLSDYPEFKFEADINVAYDRALELRDRLQTESNAVTL